MQGHDKVFVLQKAPAGGVRIETPAGLPVSFFSPESNGFDFNRYLENLKDGDCIMVTFKAKQEAGIEWRIANFISVADMPLKKLHLHPQRRRILRKIPRHKRASSVPSSSQHRGHPRIQFQRQI